VTANMVLTVRFLVFTPIILAFTVIYTTTIGAGLFFFIALKVYITVI